MGGGSVARRVTVAAAVLAVGAPAAALAAGAPVSARAQRALLGLSALPAGWSASPGGEADLSVAVGARQIAACTGVRPSAVAADPPRATTPEFDQAGGALAVDEEVQVYPSPAAARTAFGVMDSPRAPACAAAYLDAGVTSAAQGAYSATRLDLPVAGQRSCALLFSVSPTGHGAAATVDVDDVVIEDGPTVATLALTALGAPFPSTLATTLATAAARRIR